MNNESQINTEIKNITNLSAHENNKISGLYKNINQISKNIDYEQRILESSNHFFTKHFYIGNFKLDEKEISIKCMKLYTQLNSNIINTNEYIMGETEKKHPHNVIKIVIVPSFMIIFWLNSWILRKYNQIKKKDDIILDRLKDETTVVELNSISVKIKSQDNNISISEDTTTALLNKLLKFEKSEKFLKKDLTLTKLSNSLNTNPRYLSEIIKQHKGKNFNNYLNGLRIYYITNKLYNTPIFREYKISYLAETCGFASREVFSVIFKKEMGVTPSYFIRQLKKNENNVE